MSVSNLLTSVFGSVRFRTTPSGVFDLLRFYPTEDVGNVPHVGTVVVELEPTRATDFEQ